MIISDYKHNYFIDCFFPRFKNRPHMTFDDVNMAADQEFELHRDTDGTLEYTTKYV